MRSTVSISGPSARSGASSASASASSGTIATSTTTRFRPRSGSGIIGIGGSWRMRAHEVTASGVVSVQAFQAVSTRWESSHGQISQPATTSSSGNRRISSEVTIPKLPPPPRSAQKRSGSVSASVRTRRPSGSTISTAVSALAARPLRRASHPMPPPRV